MTTVPSNERLAAGSRSTMPSPVTLNFQGALERLNEVRELRHFVKLKRALHGLAGAGDFENIERKRHGHPQ